MKKSLLALTLALLLAGCAQVTPQPSESVDIPGDLPIKRCKVVDGADTGDLVLAGEDGEVYTLSVEDTSVHGDLIKDGVTVEVVYDGTILESWPARFGSVEDVSVTDAPADDRCGLYLQVLEDLWEVDPGLNTGLDELGVDFSGLTDLTESEKAALAWVFGNAHGLMPVTGTWDELVEQGYIDRENLVWNGSGCLFVLSGSAEEVFTARKWTSGIGAYMFVDCTAQQSADGTWSYTVGAEAIA